jgi:hypothetical protein
MSPRRAGRTAVVLTLAISAPGCSLVRDAPAPLSPAEAAAAGCYASTTGWYHFGIAGSSPGRVEPTWLVLRPVRNGAGTFAARFVGPPGLGLSSDERDDGLAPVPRDDDTDAPARWRVQGDTIHVVWGAKADGLRLRGTLEKGELSGWGTNPTGRFSPNGAGVWVPVECDWEMRAVRVPCEQVPRRGD